MKSIFTLILTSLAIIYGGKTFANEQSDWYIGASYSFQKASYKDLSDQEIDTTGVLAGYKINKFFSIESRLNFGISSDTFDLPTPKPYTWKTEQNIDYQSSLLVKASYNLYENLTVYGLAGYTLTKSDITDYYTQSDFNGNLIGSSTAHRKDDIKGFTYGFGLDYQLTEKVVIFIDYQLLPDMDYFNVSWSSASLGLYYSF
jgi:opacity protein-like surface antigen